MTIHSMPNNKNYDDNYDRIFGNRENTGDFRKVEVTGTFREPVKTTGVAEQKDKAS